MSTTSCHGNRRYKGIMLVYINNVMSYHNVCMLYHIAGTFCDFAWKQAFCGNNFAIFAYIYNVQCNLRIEVFANELTQICPNCEKRKIETSQIFSAIRYVVNRLYLEYIVTYQNLPSGCKCICVCDNCAQHRCTCVFCHLWLPALA